MGYGQDVENDSVSDNMSEESDNDLVENYKATMRLLISPFKQLDEFSQFKRFIEQLQKSEDCQQRLLKVISLLKLSTR